MELQIEQVSKVYKGKIALADFHANLTEGVHVLLGPNGAGKSTLMRIMAGVLKPTSGQVLVDEEDISIMGERYREMLGYLPQEFGLYKNFSAERFLMYIAALKGLNKTSAMEKVDEVLHLVHLEDVRHVKTGKLSGGMKQRLGIAQSLLNDPKILIVDEPTAGLDPRERIRFRNMLAQLADDRIVVLSTHIISDVEFVAKDILLVKSGRLVERDHPESLLKNLEGKVWMLSCSESEMREIQNKFKVAHVIRTQHGIELRILSDFKPTPDAKPIAASLEDLYLYHFDEEAITDEATVAHPI